MAGSTDQRRLDVGGGGSNNGGVEARIAKLESDVGHIKTDIADIKTDGRTLVTKVDSIKDSISSAKVWALLLYIGLGAAILGVMARGFHWL